MKRPSRPSHFALGCLIISAICGVIDIQKAVAQDLFIFPIYHVGILTIVWTDYLKITVPVTVAWFVLGLGTWRGS